MILSDAELEFLPLRTQSLIYTQHTRNNFFPVYFLDSFFFPIDLLSVFLVKKFEWNVQKKLFSKMKETPPIYQLSPRAVQLL